MTTDVAAGKANQDASQRSPLWRIDRFELIFYNSRNRRWQYFAENPLVPSDAAGNNKESLHRREIRSLLSTMRETVESCLLVSKNAVFTLAELRRFSTSGDAGKIEVVSPPSSAVPSSVWGLYLNYLKATAKREGVPPEHFQNLDSWIANPTEKKFFSHDEALTVLSLLPIIEDWDTWGCFLRARNQSLKEGAESFPPVSASDWSEPFSIVELLYSDHGSYPCPESCSQKGLLSKHTQIEGLCQDLGDPSGQTHHVTRADFFDRRYCKLPRGEEKFLYQCYAHLIDPIFAAPAEQSNRRQFVIAYPISIGGRLHFLQMIVSAEEGSEVSVCSLWIDWQSIHRALWTTETKAFLQDELLRILTSAFQNEAYYHLSTLGQAAQNVQHLPLSVLRHIYHLLPVEAGVYQSHFYSYHDDTWPDPPDSGLEPLYVGSKWRCAPSKTPDKKTDSLLEVATPYGLTLFLRKLPKRHQIWEITGKHRVVQVVEQQMQYLENLQNALNDVTRRKEEDRQKCAMVVYGFLRSMNDSDMDNRVRNAERELPQEILSARVVAPVTDVGDDFVPYRFRQDQRRQQFGRYLDQAYPGQTPEQTTRVVQSLIRPSLLLLLSEYFETGPVKLATHSFKQTDLLSHSIDDAMQYTERLHATVSKALLVLHKDLKARKLRSKSRVHNSKRLTRTDLAAFHRLLSSAIRSQDSGKKKKLEITRRSLEIEKFSLGADRDVFCRTANQKDPPYKKHSRLFGICPDCLLRDVIREYEKDIASKYRPTDGAFHHEWQLRDDIRYSSPYHGTDQFPVYLVEHLLFLPYVISDRTEWKNNSEFVNCWAMTGASIGSLYTFSCVETERTPTAELLLIHPDNTADRTFLAIASRAKEFDQYVKCYGPSSYLVIELQHWWMNDNP